MRPQILLRRIDVDITFPFMRPDRDLRWSLRPGFRGVFMGKMVSVSTPPECAPLRVGILGHHAGTSNTEDDFIDQLHLSVDGNRRLAGMLAAQLVEDGLVYPAGD
jgi:hypothetical protein